MEYIWVLKYNSAIVVFLGSSFHSSFIYFTIYLNNATVFKMLFQNQQVAKMNSKTVAIILGLVSCIAAGRLMF